jgi:hypothetical protein
MKLARKPCGAPLRFAALRSSTMVSAGAMPISGAKVNSNWLGPNSTSSERSGRPSPTSARRMVPRIPST